MKRIVLVINKSWEADAVFAALFNADFKTFPPKYYEKSQVRNKVALIHKFFNGV